MGRVNKSDVVGSSVTRIMAADRSTPTGENSRKTGRVHTEPVECSLGEVLDISAGGVRLRCRRKLEGVQTMSIGSLILAGKVAWCRKLGRKKFEVGLEFVNLEPVQARALTNIATANRACGL